MNMKVVIINRSDCVGGAAVVSARLLDALRNVGVEASMLVMQASATPPIQHVREYGRGWKEKFYFLAERLQIFVRNGFSRKNLFKVDTAAFGYDLSAHPLVKEADIICLNWINQGAMSMRGIDKLCSLGKPIVWTMHDMWNMTGVCHHALDCQRFLSNCGKCQFLSSSALKDLSTSVMHKKRVLYEAHRGKLHFVAVSHWLESVARKSSLMSDLDIRTIPNAFPIENFQYNRLPNFEGIAPDKKVIIIGAARLDDPIKGFPLLINTMNEIADHRSDLAQRLHLVMFGNLRNASLAEQIRLPYTLLGTITNEQATEAYQRADIVLSTSTFETLSGTIIEGAASGCIPVAAGQGGFADIIDNNVNGYIAKEYSAQALADAIECAANSHLDRQCLHNTIAEKFASENVAKQYKQLFLSLC